MHFWKHFHSFVCQPEQEQLRSTPQKAWPLERVPGGQGSSGALIPMPCTCPQLTNKIVFVVSFVGNRGTFIRGYKAMVMDMEFLYHVGYILTSVLGLFAHELFYSILVRPGWGPSWAGVRGSWGFPKVARSSIAPISVQSFCCLGGQSGFPDSSSDSTHPSL